MTTQESEISFDLKKVGKVFILFLIGLSLTVLTFYFGYQKGNYDLAPEEEMFKTLESYLELHYICAGPICLSENNTLAEIRQKYYDYRNYPNADTLILAYYRTICKGW